MVAYIDATAAPEAQWPPTRPRRVRPHRGNPLFIREVLTSARCRPRERLAASGELDLPAEVRDVIDRRLYRISSAARDALAAGAVAGPSFSFSVLEHVAEVSDDPDALVASLEEAAAAGLVREVVGDRFRFSHAARPGDALHAASPRRGGCGCTAAWRTRWRPSPARPTPSA